MKRICFAVDLNDDAALIEAYEAWHAPGGPPAAVIRSIRAAGIEAMEIYRCGDRLFMIMDVSETFSAEAKARSDAADPEIQAWETLMWTFQRPLPWARPGEKWLEARKIFDLPQA